MAVSIEQIKELREATGAGIMECRKALEQSDGDFDKAVEYLHQKGMEKAAERANRETLEGMIELYSHGEGRVGVIVEVNCETDFVARSQEFRTFAHEIALQIAAAAPLYVSEEDIPEEILEGERQNARQYAIDEGKPEAVIERIVEGRLAKFKDDVSLLNQPYIRDDDLTVDQLLTKNIISIGEKIIIRRFERWELGEETT
jgi:elongation factor Ts